MACKRSGVQFPHPPLHFRNKRQFHLMWNLAFCVGSGLFSMSRLSLLISTAQTDKTFEKKGVLWVGKCLICNGPVAFDGMTGEGATLEHIRATSRGGTNAPDNLGIVHAACNSEKGRRWDSKRKKSEAEYERFVELLIQKRQKRWPGLV